jgi:hypothetical protein
LNKGGLDDIQHADERRGESSTISWDVEKFLDRNLPLRFYNAMEKKGLHYALPSHEINEMMNTPSFLSSSLATHIR